MLLLLEEIDLIFANTSFGSCILLLFNKYKIYFEPIFSVTKICCYYCLCLGTNIMLESVGLTAKDWISKIAKVGQ